MTRPLPTDRSAAPTGRRAAEILDAAAALFEERGYHATSMEDIATRVGIRKPTLYHYYSSKDEIVYWIHEEFIDLMISQHRRRLEIGLDPPQLIFEVMADILVLVETKRGHVRAFLDHYRELPPGEQAQIREKRDEYERLVREALEAGIARGMFRPVHARVLAFGIFGLCNWAYNWFQPEGPLAAREVAYMYWDVLMHGMEPQRSGVAAPTGDGATG